MLLVQEFKFRSQSSIVIIRSHLRLVQFFHSETLHESIHVALSKDVKAIDTMYTEITEFNDGICNPVFRSIP